MLETPFIYLQEGYNVVVTWYHGFVLSLGYYDTQAQDWEAYTQEVAKFSMKRCCIVGNTAYGSSGGVVNSCYMPMGRYG